MGTESLAWFLIVIAVFGLIVGAIGRLLVPGGNRLGLVETLGAGVAGALIGGFVGRLLLGPRLTQGWIWVLSILGAALVVAVVSRRGGVGYGGYPRRRLMSERAYDDRVVVDDVDRPYRTTQRPWSGRRHVGRTYDDDVEAGGPGGYGRGSRFGGLGRLGGLGGFGRGGRVGRSYAAPARRRRRFF